MYKWSRQPHNDRPTTPKMTSVALPDEMMAKRLGTPQKPAALEKPQKTGSLFSRLTNVSRRATTPLPTPSKVKEAMYGARTSRVRTVSMSHVVDDDIKKPHKMMYTAPLHPVVPTPPHINNGGPHMLEANQQKALKSALKGGSLQRSSSQMPGYPSSTHVERHSPPRHMHPPPDHLASDQFHHRTRRQSVDRRETHIPPPSHVPINPSSYVRAHVQSVPMKPEVISLSWPLVESARRRKARMPAVYYDVAFDPWKDHWAVRANRGGHWSPLTLDEGDTPASPHCKLTDMVITNHLLAQWPITVRRSRGIRCIDIFRAIFETYDVPLSKTELRHIGPSYIDRCGPAFLQRCEDAAGLTLYNEKCGMRRVDLLRGKRIFKGLKSTTPSPENGGAQWELEFD